jgi:hypothetical protein
LGVFSDILVCGDSKPVAWCVGRNNERVDSVNFPLVKVGLVGFGSFCVDFGVLQSKPIETFVLAISGFLAVLSQGWFRHF